MTVRSRLARMGRFREMHHSRGWPQIVRRCEGYSRELLRFCRHPAPSAKMAISFPLLPRSGIRSATWRTTNPPLEAASWSRTAARWHAQPRLVQGRQRESLQMRLVAFYGITRRGGNNDRLSTLWREVISLAGVARSFSKGSSYRNFQCRHRDAMPD
jgi:hypothetical protein